MKVKCEIMRLKNDKINDYEDMHLNPWPELIHELAKAGFHELYTFIDGNVVIVIMKSDSVENSYRRLEKTETFNKWTTIVRSMLTKNNKVVLSSDDVINAKCIFNLTELLKNK